MALDFSLDSPELAKALNPLFAGRARGREAAMDSVDISAQGEEFECAVFLDTHPRVWYWVRNLPRRDYSFWLQTSTDRFYPDFVALLNDGRILVVELKGGHLWGSPDSEEKRKLGELWAERSGGSCLFVMPKGKDWSAIEALLQTLPPSGSLFEEKMSLPTGR